MGTFQRINYPDGQISAKYIPDENFPPPPLRITGYDLRFRINSYDDLMFVRACAELIKNNRAKASLFIPCLFGQRSDRRFDDNQSFDLKIIAEVINNCDFDYVQILDPHSDVALALIDRSVKISSFEYVQKVVSDLYEPKTGINTCNFTLVSPDAGAYKKVFEYGEKMNLPVVAAMKCRVDGIPAITFTHDVKDKHCLIVDDLCDGGATFISLAKLLKLQGAQKVYLYVTHGLFSKGFAGLYEAGISHVYCTNSVRDIDPDVAKVYRTSDNMYPDNYIESDYVTQYKVI